MHKIDILDRLSPSRFGPDAAAKDRIIRPAISFAFDWIMDKGTLGDWEKFHIHEAIEHVKGGRVDAAKDSVLDALADGADRPMDRLATFEVAMLLPTISAASLEAEISKLLPHRPE